MYNRTKSTVPGIEAGQAEEQHAGDDVENIKTRQAQHQPVHIL